MKKKDEMDYTGNSRVYKMFRRTFKLSCEVCPPNKGCNRRRKKELNNWKNYRKNQWKEERYEN